MIFKPNNEIRILPEGFTPTPLDVICGRDQDSFYHEANQNLRTIVRKCIYNYELASTKKEKSAFVIDIVDRIRQERHEGGFVRKDHETGRWMEIGEVKAREKVGHAIRIEIKKRLNRKKYVRRSTSQASCSIASTYLECKEALSPPNQQAQGIFTACIEANLEPLVQQTCARPEVCTIVFPSQNEHEDHFSPRPLPLDDDKTVLESILQDKGPCPHASILSLSFKPEMKEDDALKCIYQIRLKVTTAKWQKA